MYIKNGAHKTRFTIAFPEDEDVVDIKATLVRDSGGAWVLKVLEDYPDIGIARWDILMVTNVANDVWCVNLL